MSTFNSYVVFDEEGYLIIDERETKGTPDEYFNGLSSIIRGQAHVMLVLQESGHVTKYMVTRKAPTLGPRQDLAYALVVN